MPNVREGEIRVAPYTYRRGRTLVRVRGHPTHYEYGSPAFVVLFRPRNVRATGGSREHPRVHRYPWHVRGRYASDAAAKRMRRRLRREGFTAIVERIGGREPMPSLAELVSDAERGDRERREAR